MGGNILIPNKYISFLFNLFIFKTINGTNLPNTTALKF